MLAAPVPPPARRILGIDPGLQVTGYAVLDPTPAGPRIAEAGVIRSAESGRDAADMARRLKVIYDSITEVFDQWRPGVVVVEQLFAHYEHPRTAILMAHARGVFFLCGGQRGVPVLSYPASRIKKVVTGSGRAGKEQMQHAVMRELNLAKPPEPHDVADAVAVALCHYYLSASVVRGGASSAVFTGVNLKMLGEDPDADPEPDEDEGD
jgi:crossover junction endodeoxyribonuclease RuvC